MKGAANKPAEEAKPVKRKSVRRASGKVLVRVRSRKRLDLEGIELAIKTLGVEHPAAIAIEDWLDLALDGSVSKAVGPMSDAELRSWKGELSAIIQLKQHWEIMRDPVVRRVPRAE